MTIPISTTFKASLRSHAVCIKACSLQQHRPSATLWKKSLWSRVSASGSVRVVSPLSRCIQNLSEEQLRVSLPSSVMIK